MMTDEEKRYVEMLGRLSSEDLNKVQRMIMRMNNKSPKVTRLTDLFEAGQISARDFVDIAGA